MKQRIGYRSFYVWDAGEQARLRRLDERAGEHTRCGNGLGEEWMHGESRVPEQKAFHQRRSTWFGASPFEFRAMAREHSQ